LRLRAALKRTNALGILSALALPLPAAAESIWGGSGSTSATTDYNTATNWSNPPGVAPISAGTSAVFANSGPGKVNVSAAVSPNSWTFATNAQSYTITGANVTFNTGTGLIDNANAGQSISIDNSLGGAGGIQLNGNSTLTLTTINTYTGATTIIPAQRWRCPASEAFPFQASSPPMVRSIFPVRQFPSRRSARWPAAALSSSVTTAW
jgi:autotransporter-associated beta strand protein